MLKLRLMGTKEEIRKYREVLEKNKRYRITEFSDFYSITSSSKYYRVYVELVENTND